MGAKLVMIATGKPHPVRCLELAERGQQPIRIHQRPVKQVSGNRDHLRLQPVGQLHNALRKAFPVQVAQM